VLARPLIQSDDSRETIYAVAGIAVAGSLFLLTPLYQALAGVIGVPWQVLGILIVSALLVGATLTRRYDATRLYILVWGGFITSAAFTQTRFNYYLAIAVAVFNALFVAWVVEYLDLQGAIETATESAREIEGWQVIVGVTVLFLIIGPFVFPTVAAWDSGGNNGPSPSAPIWENSLEWMNDETPQPGTLGGADNAMDPDGTYSVPDDGNFDYPDGAYGVQSWWDYGHWITVHGERIPNANPFQQNAGNAARYLLAPNETAANEVLNETMDEGDQTRYVMVDHKMVTFGSKFGAPTVFNDRVNRGDFRTTYPVTRNNRVITRIFAAKQPYYESQMVRLYAYHGSAADPAPVVVEPQSQTATYQGRRVRADAASVTTFRTLSAARRYVENNPRAQLGGLGMNPTERVSALEHYRLVHSNSVNALRGRTQLRRNNVRIARGTNASLNRLFRTTPSWVKTFEKVPGATVEGSGAPAGAEISTTVQVNNPAADRNFTYTQYATADESGNFKMTLPYSTTGYDNFGPENGYTNVSVRAVSDYRFRTTSDTGSLYTDSATVTEAQVVGVDDDSVRVQLTETQPTVINRQSIQAAG
jgi:dolichyl-diphosphooligosaccharide--protein glycosyltransferase